MFQHHEYISIDFGDRRVGISRKKEVGTGDTASDAQDSPLHTETFQQPPGDALLTEIRAFVDAVRDSTPAVVSGRDGRAALNVALDIDRLIAKSVQK